MNFRKRTPSLETVPSRGGGPNPLDKFRLSQLFRSVSEVYTLEESQTKETFKYMSKNVPLFLAILY